MQVLEHADTDVEDVAIKLAEAITEPYDMDSNAKEYLDLENATYTRELFIPAGTILIGKQHKKSCVNIITKGKLVVKASVEDEGIELDVPHDKSYIFTSNAGGRKLLYVIEDTIFINVFSNIEAQCLEDVEAEVVIPSEKYDKYMKDKELAWHGD